MNNMSKKCKYKLCMIKWSSNIYAQSPPVAQQPQITGNDTNPGMHLTHQSQYYNSHTVTSQIFPQSGSNYAPYVTDSKGYRYPLAIYPITKAYAAREMHGMEHNLITKSDWIPDGLYVVQRAIEEVNEKDRIAGAAAQNGGSGGGGSGNSGSYGDIGDGGGRNGGARDDTHWEMCGFRFDMGPEWNQIALLLEKVIEEGTDN